MKKTFIYIARAAAIGAVLVPVVALAALQPTVPTGIGGQTVTGSSVVALINQIVNYIVVVSVVIAVGFFIYGAIRYAMGNAEVGTSTMKNAAIGLAFMLGVGLIVNTIAGFINRGLNLG